MDPVLEDRLMAAFPRLYRERLHCDCAGGWFTLLWHLSAQLEELISQLSEPEQEEHFAVQIKEKWGLLTFYLSTYTDDMQRVIAAAEEESRHICEVCGASGTLYDNGRLMTRCPQHAPEGRQPVVT